MKSDECVTDMNQICMKGDAWTEFRIAELAKLTKKAPRPTIPDFPPPVPGLRENSTIGRVSESQCLACLKLQCLLHRNAGAIQGSVCFSSKDLSNSGSNLSDAGASILIVYIISVICTSAP